MITTDTVVTATAPARGRGHHVAEIPRAARAGLSTGRELAFAPVGVYIVNDAFDTNLPEPKPPRQERDSHDDLRVCWKFH